MASEAPSNTRTYRGEKLAKRRFSVVVLRLAAILFVGYLAIIGLFMFNETDLVYPGSKYPRGDWEPNNFNFEEIAFESKDGTRLVGWYLQPPPSQSANSQTAGVAGQTVLVCHGNAVNVAQCSAWTGEMFRKKLGADVFVFDYRGFGKSDGTPNEPGVLADAEAALEWLCQKTGKSSEQIILVGQSIGGGPAVHLAAKYNCKILVLQRTFASLADTAHAHYPWLPVRLLMRNQFPSAQKIKTFDSPLFQSHGDCDTVVPINLGRKLFKCASSTNKKFLEIQDMGHMDVLPENYWTELQGFVQELEQPEHQVRD